jgi:hypothetical protein
VTSPEAASRRAPKKTGRVTKVTGPTRNSSLFLACTESA